MSKKRRSKKVTQQRGEQPTPHVAGTRRSISLGTAAFLITALLVAAFFVLMQLLRANEPFGIDQGLFACFGRWIPQGWLPYRDMWDIKPPGLLYTYALAFRLFGCSVTAMWWFEGLWLAATAVVTYSLARKLWGRWAGLAAAFCLMVGTWAPGWGGYWSRAQGEVFLMLPLMAAAWTTLLARDRTAAALWTGLLMGVVGLYKIPAMLLLAVWPWYWLRRGHLKQWLLSSLLLALGVAVVWSVVLGYFLARGALADMWAAIFFYAHAYPHVTADDIPWPDLILQLVYRMSPVVPSLLLTGAVGAGLLVARRCRTALLWLLPWLAAGVGVVIFQRQLAGYHFLFIIPPLALAAGYGLVQILQGLANGNKLRRFLALITLLAVLILGVKEVLTWRQGYGPNLACHLGKIERPEFLLTLSAGAFSPAIEEAVAAQVRRQTAPDDGILIWSVSPGIYFLSNRHPATKYPFHHLLFTEDAIMWNPPGLEQRRREFIERLRRDPPALILVGTEDTNEYEPLDSYTQMVQFPQFHALVQTDYQQVGQLANFIFYRRKQAAPLLQLAP